MTISQSTVDRIRLEYPVCFRCGGKAEELHHAVYKRAKKFPQLDEAENLVMLCHKCNAESGKGYVQSWFFRCLVYSHKLELGYRMDEWLDNIGMKSPDHFIYIGKNERFKQNV
jgi:ribosomal protein L40E